jgi:hypothetical protein
VVLRLRFQPPPPRTEHADFLYSALLPAWRQGLCDLSSRECFRLGLQSQDLRHILQPLQSSPCRISSDSGLADYRAFLSLRPCLPFRQKSCDAAGFLRSLGITPVRRYFEPIRHRLAFSRFPGVSGYAAYLPPPISRWVEDGLSSCSTCPCHRAAPTAPPECHAASVNPDVVSQLKMNTVEQVRNFLLSRGLTVNWILGGEGA